MDIEEKKIEEKNNNFPIIIIKTEIPTLNEYIKTERSNKFKAAKVKKEKTLAVAKEVLSQTRDIINCKVNLDVCWYIKSDHDPDNIFFGIKFILDGIVVAGLLKNDCQKHIGSITNTYVKGHERKVVLNFWC